MSATATRKSKTHTVKAKTEAPVITTPEEIELQALDAQDQARLDEQIIFEGSKMSREHAQRILADREANRPKAPSFIDLQDIVNQHVSDEQLLYRVRSSMAWALDVVCIDLARDVFWRIRADQIEAGNTLDSFNDYVSLVADMKANEDWKNSLGYEENTGPFQQLAIALALREQWHAEAGSAASGAMAGGKYTPKTLEELLKAEKPMQLKAEQVANFETLAKTATRKKPEHYEQVLEQLKKSFDIRAAARVETNKLTEPAVRTIFAMAETIEAEDAHFHLLPVRTQARLAKMTLSSMQRALNDLATRMNAVAYALACAEGFEAIDALEPIVDELAAKVESV